MRRQLAQLAPDSTSAVTLFQPTENKPYTIDLINICNTGAGTIEVSIYHDADGVTYSDTTCLLKDYTLHTKEALNWEVPISDYRKAGSVGVEVSVADSASFTAYGVIVGEQV